MKFSKIMQKCCINSNMGAIGIGAMIVFIAIILIAGIAASVLIQTSATLESQALSTGSDTSKEVASGISIINIQGHIGNSSSRIDRIVIMVRSRSGSGDMDISRTLLEISDGSNKYILNYSQSHFASTSSSAGIFSTPIFDTLTNDDYGIIEIKDNDDSCSKATPVINRGDKILIAVNTSTTFGNDGLDVRTDIWGNLLPENGASATIEFRTPGVYTDTVIVLQE